MPGPVLVAAPLPPGTLGAFTTRFGGVSAAPRAELNLGLQVGDDPAAVARNRDRLAARFGGPVTFARQVHGAAVCTVDSDAIPAGGYDALVTTCAGRAVGVLVADCLPVLFADPAAGVVAAAHAGRRGLRAGVLQNTLAAMAAAGAAPGRITAVIGPGIGGCCYEVPSALRDEVAAELPEAGSTTRAGTPSLDLPRAAAALLRTAGVGHVERIPACTYDDERFYSYRRQAVTGRFAGVVVLR